MELGVVFPTSEIGNDPVAIRDYGQAAEALGYTHLLAYDHVVGAAHEGRDPLLRGPYDERDAFHEPLVLFAYLAAVTSTLELATGVLVLPQRQAVLVAKQTAELAVLSEGRLRLGVGTGWNHVEYEALGMPFERRGEVLEEQVAVLRALWTQPLVEFRGRYHVLDRVAIEPRPPEPIPLWFGGDAPASLRRAARLGDGFVFPTSGTKTCELAARLRQSVTAGGRDVRSFAVGGMVDFHKGEHGWREAAAAWASAGGTHLALRTVPIGKPSDGDAHRLPSTPQEHIEALETFMEAVADHRSRPDGQGDGNEADAGVVPRQGGQADAVSAH